MRKPEMDTQSFTVSITPKRSPEPVLHDGTGFDPIVILEAALLGAIGGLAGEIGVAAACGDPLTPEDVWIALVSGAAAGIAASLVDVFGGNDLFVTIVGEFVAGFISQALSGSTPLPFGRTLCLPSIAG
ncbi:MAG: hypothetical protein ACM3WU_01110 [Bacillota bacterium]